MALTDLRSQATRRTVEEMLEHLESFELELKVENVRRLRHRASLALWCGNNEMEF